MTYTELARKIKNAYKDLRKDEVYKLYNVMWNDELDTAEITVENDAGFRAVIIGNTSGMKGSRGYMYLFYTNDDSEVFPTVRELARRLKAVAAQEALTDENADYFDWKEYGSLEKQRVFLRNSFKSIGIIEKEESFNAALFCVLIWKGMAFTKSNILSI